jgi:hypothetical protein
MKKNNLCYIAILMNKNTILLKNWYKQDGINKGIIIVA